MSKSTALLTLLLVLALMIGTFGCTEKEETPTPTPVTSPTTTPTPVPTATPTLAPLTTVHNITRKLSGIYITLVMASWTSNEVEIEWRIENPTGQKFKASRLYSIFQPGAYAVDQDVNEGEYFIPPLIYKDLEPGKFITYRTRLLFYPESTRITIRLADVYSENSTFVDISTVFSFPR